MKDVTDHRKVNIEDDTKTLVRIEKLIDCKLEILGKRIAKG